MEKRKKISLMLAVILILQIIMPLLTGIIENDFTVFSIAADEEETNTWDVSANGDGSVIATLDDNGTMTISGNGKMKDYGASNIPYDGQKEKITTIKINNGVTNIGSSAFEFCYNLTSIVISNSVTNIGGFAFFRCNNLIGIEIPDSVISIGDMAFYNCRNLTSIEIPKSVTSIGKYVFQDCYSLESINVAKENEKYCSINGVLFDKEKTNLLQYPAGKKEKSHIIPLGVTSIGDRAFYSCSSLVSIKIPDIVTSIGNRAFYNCGSLTIICNPNSYAETYAKENNIAFNYLGDTNNDKNIDIKDIMEINLHRLGKKSLERIPLEVSDVNDDGHVNFADIARINLYRLGKITTL